MRKLAMVICIMFMLPAYAGDTAISNTSKLTLASKSFTYKSQLASRYTCDGKDSSPDLSWKNAPPHTNSFALIVADHDAPGGTFYHWVLFNIPKTVHGLSEAMKKLPLDSKVGNNGWGKAQYNGPCPPVGAPHTYIFTLYALDTMLDLPTGADVQTILSAMQQHILAQTDLITTYGRNAF